MSKKKLNKTNGKPVEIDDLCAALGFTIVVLNNGKSKDPDALAKKMAEKLRDFVISGAARRAVNENQLSPNLDSALTIQRMIDQLMAVLSAGSTPTKEDLLRIGISKRLIDKHWTYALYTAKELLSKGE